MTPERLGTWHGIAFVLGASRARAETPASAVTWYYDNGAIHAHRYFADGADCLLFPGIAEFQLRDREVTAVPLAESTPRDQIVDLYCRSVLPLVLETYGQQVLHASAVVTDRGVVAFTAPALGGKSTLAFGLMRRGYPLWADDALAFAHCSDRTSTQAVWLPFSTRLRPDARAYFGDARADERASIRERPPLAAILVLDRRVAARPQIERLLPTTGFTELLIGAYAMDLHDQARKQALIEEYLELSARVPVYRLSFPAEIEQLPTTLDVIESELGICVPAAD